MCINRFIYLCRKEVNGNRVSIVIQLVLCTGQTPGRSPRTLQSSIRTSSYLFDSFHFHLFPFSSIIAGFRRQQNLCEMIAPSKPWRQATPETVKGCFPCNPLRSCGLHEGGNLQTVDHVRPLYDGRRHNIKKKVDCLTTNAVYYIYCPRAHPSEYVGSAQNGMRDRWDKHSAD